MLDARAQIDLGPRRLEFLSPIVARVQVVSAVQVKLPHVLHHRVAPHAATGAVVDVVVHLSVVHERAGPLIKIAVITAEPGGGLDCAPLRQQEINRQSVHLAGWNREHRRGAGTHCAAPFGHAVVHEISKIRLRIVRVRRANGAATLVCGCDPIADEAPMRLQRARQRNRIDIVSGKFVSPRSVVTHCHTRPLVRVGRVVSEAHAARIGPGRIVFHDHPQCRAPRGTAAAAQSDLRQYRVGRAR